MTEQGYDALSERLLNETENEQDDEVDNNILLRTPQIWMSPSHPFVDTQKQPSILSSTYSLTSTIIGAGVLALPFAFKGTGLALGIMLLLITTALARYSCSLLVSAYLRTHQGSYDDLANHLFGPCQATITRIVIILLNLGGSAAYVVVIKELLSPSLCFIFPNISDVCNGGPETIANSSFAITPVAFLMFGVVYPLSCLETLSSLQISSKLAFLCTLFLSIAISFRGIEALTNTKEHTPCKIEMGPHDAIAVFRSLPLFAFSFVCHLNVLPVYDELRSRTPGRMRRVIGQAMIFCSFFYIAIGGFGYSKFCEHTPNNILGFPTNDTKHGANDQLYFDQNDKLIIAARIAETLTCILALPFLQFPVRLAIHGVISSWYKKYKQSNASSLTSDNAGYVQLHGSDGVEVENGTTEVDPSIDAVLSSPMLRYVECLFLVSSCFFTALLIPNIRVIFGLLGSTLCSYICFILPASFYLRSVSVTNRTVANENQYPGKIESWISVKTFMASLLFVYGAIIMIVGTVINISDIVQGT